MKFMLKFEINWSDEFDCEQFELLDSTYSGVEDRIASTLDEECWYIGTNQELYDVERSNFEIIELTQDEWITLNKLFPSRIFGVGIL